MSLFQPRAITLFLTPHIQYRYNASLYIQAYLLSRKLNSSLVSGAFPLPAPVNPSFPSSCLQVSLLDTVSRSSGADFRRESALHKQSRKTITQRRFPMNRLKLSAAALLLAFGIPALAAVPQVSPEMKANAETMWQDAVFQKMYDELKSEEGQKWRFNTLMELVRIASPSRLELRRQQEITKRLVNEWGFSPEDIMTTPEGIIKGAGLQIVDGKPVYNVCVRIPGTYPQRPGAESYKGQFPKVLFEGHIDTVNPAELPPETNPYVPVKLQKAKEPLVATPAELEALKDEIHFDKNGRVIEDENWKKAYRRFNDLDEAVKADAYRIYVTGFGDAMINTVSVLTAAKMMKKYGIKPVYDVWFCGTAGEEGKGNLCGMKQLYGYNQDTGKGNNALNFVANVAADSLTPGSSIVNYLGSYRFEITYSERDGFRGLP